MMTLLLGPLGVNKSTILFALVDKVDSNLKVKESITPKLHRKSIYTQNQSSSSWIPISLCH
jgi:guanylate kinase